MGSKYPTSADYNCGMLKLSSLLCLLFLVGGAWANKNCMMPGEVGKMVAHGIHSLTLNMVRHYFEPQAAPNNGIPTVNLNRSEENILNENAVFVNLTNSHPYPPFFALDHILSHMDDEHYGIKHANPLDEIGHAMHMHSIWQRASELYKTVAESNDFCNCLLETYNDSIMDHLELLAQEIRFPEQFADQINAARDREYAAAVAETTKSNRRILGIDSISKEDWIALDMANLINPPRPITRPPPTTTTTTTTTTRPPVYVGGYGGGFRPGGGRPGGSTWGTGGRPGGSAWGSGGRPAIARGSGGGSLEPDNVVDLSIVDEASWEAWKAYMAEPGPEFMDDLLYNLVHYLYCKLNY